MIQFYQRIRDRLNRSRFERRFPISDALRIDLGRIAEGCPSPRGGGSSFEKRQLLANLIVSHSLRRSVEIGVFAGSSLFPQVLAMRITGGLAIGIDPWCPQAATQRENLERIHADLAEDWYCTMDWDGLYCSVSDCLERHSLSKYCRLIRGRSLDVAGSVKCDYSPLDLLHIDGNHDRAQCAADIEHYLPMVRSGGYIVLDDVAWDSIWPLYQNLRACYPLVYEA